MNQNLQNISLNSIKFSGSNPRKKINDKSLKELAASIKENGVLQPIIVRPNGSGDTWELIAGERRGRAALRAGMVTIPAVIRSGDGDDKVLRLQIIENLQRENVGYFEEARAIKNLRDTCDLDVAEICKTLGKSEAYVYMQLSLCEMPEKVLEAMENGWITKGVAWEIARLPALENKIKAISDLARKEKSKLISISRAKFYIAETFGENRVSKPKRNYAQKQTGSDYQANWKKYLIKFDCDQFENFKRICRGRTDTQTLAEAVDLVMRTSE